MPPRGGNAKKESGRAKKAENEAKKKDAATTAKVRVSLAWPYDQYRNMDIYRNVSMHPSGIRVLKRIRVSTRRPSARSCSPVRRNLPVSSRRRKPTHHPRKPLSIRPAIKRRTPSPQVLAPFLLEADLVPAA